MNRLNKGQCPDVLSEKGAIWTTEFMAARAAGNVSDTQRFRYRDPTIKAAILEETFKKCAYCESKVTHVHPGETDHILPVSKRPELFVSWENLTLVCTECNRRKGDYFDNAEPLVNPYVDEPDEHLIFWGPIVLNRPGSLMGYRTEKQIELSRQALIERRTEKMMLLRPLIDQWQMTADGPTRELLKKEIMKEAVATAEFSATTRSYLRQALEWDF